MEVTNDLVKRVLRYIRVMNDRGVSLTVFEVMAYANTPMPEMVRLYQAAQPMNRLMDMGMSTSVVEYLKKMGWTHSGLNEIRGANLRSLP